MKEYVQYMRDVLGLQNVMISADDSNQNTVKFYTAQGPFVPPKAPYYELIFLNIVTETKESFFNIQVAELFEKMKAAMKLKNLQVLELDCTIEDRSQLPSELAKFCEGKYIVVFSSFPQNISEFILKGPSRWIETYSPAYLLEDAAAKKVVWNDLQKVMKELSL